MRFALKNLVFVSLFATFPTLLSATTPEVCLNAIDAKIRNEQLEAVFHSRGTFTDALNEKVMEGLGYPSLQEAIVRNRKWYHIRALTPILSEWVTSTFSKAIVSDAPRWGD